MILIGLMSGTSADGTDAVCVRIEGAPPELHWQLLSHVSLPHPEPLRDAIFSAFRPETSRVDTLCPLHFELGEAFAQAALAACRAAGLRPDEVDAIGSHGQTVWHIPPGQAETPSTLQLGSPAVIAQRTGITVVSDFRARDMAAGGQGAPLVPYVDYLLLADATRSRAVQNIGGIGNVTYLPAGRNPDAVIAFDTGPGNMLMDYAASRATGGRLAYDQDGRLARSGRIDSELLDAWMADPYFSLPPPKSTGRERFGVQRAARYYDAAEARGLSAPDILATLTAFTAASIADSYRRYLPGLPDEALISGGGARNPALLEQLALRLAPCAVRLTDDVGLPTQAKESVAFALLAYETLHHRPGNLPAATGASSPVVLGSITYA